MSVHKWWMGSFEVLMKLQIHEIKYFARNYLFELSSSTNISSLSKNESINNSNNVLAQDIWNLGLQLQPFCKQTMSKNTAQKASIHGKRKR